MLSTQLSLLPLAVIMYEFQKQHGHFPTEENHHVAPKRLFPGWDVIDAFLLLSVAYICTSKANIKSSTTLVNVLFGVFFFFKIGDS